MMPLMRYRTRWWRSIHAGGGWPVEDRPDIAVQVAITAGGSVHTVYVSAAGCPDDSGSAGGIDDGTTLRTLTRNACQALLKPPIVLYSASGDIGNNCLG